MKMFTRTYDFLNHTAPKNAEFGEVTCPTCGEFNVHAYETGKLEGEDIATAGIPNIDLTTYYYTRFECENGQHCFEVAFQFHKGRTLIRVKAVEKRQLAERGMV
jgi:hypothetical protein